MVFPENYSKIPIVFTNLAPILCIVCVFGGGGGSQLLLLKRCFIPPINKLSKDSLILYINFDCKEIYH